MPTPDVPLLERELVPAAPPQLEGGVAPSPYNFLFTGEDNLRVTSHNSQTGVAIAIQGRMWSPTDGIRAFGHVHVPHTDRSAREELFGMGEGYLLNLSCFAQAGSPVLGQTFVRVQVVRGFSGAVYVLGTLVQGYLVANQDRAFPGSPLGHASDVTVPRVVIGTNPAAGANANDQVPTGARWLVLGYTIELATDATAVNRRIAIRMDGPSGSFICAATHPGAQGPSTTLRWYAWAGRESFIDNLLNVASHAMLPTPPVPLGAGQLISTTVENLQAGDNLDAPLITVIEQLEVL